MLNELRTDSFFRGRRVPMRYLAAILLFGTAIALFWIYTRPISRSLQPGPRTHRLSYLGTIRDALARYKYDNHGKLPQQLSELVPIYVSRTNIAILFGPADAINPQFRIADAHLARMRFIDDSGAYVYLGGQDDQTSKVILYERPGIWQEHPSSPMYRKLNALLWDYSIRSCSIEELEQLGVRNLQHGGDWQ